MIRKRGKRGRFAYQVIVTGCPAKTFPTKEAAEAYELDLRLRRSLGPLYREAAPSFGDASREFIDRQAAMRGWRDRTLADREVARNAWRAIWQMPCDRLAKRDVERLVAAKAKAHPRSAKRMVDFLKAVLRDLDGYQFDPGLFKITVTYRARVGEVTDTRGADEIGAYLPDSLVLLPAIAVRTGLRWGELMALETRDLDLANARLYVRASKTPAGKRVVLLTDKTVALLREQLVARPAGTSLVFPHVRKDGSVGKWDNVHSSLFGRVWREAASAAALPGFKFHWLRHSAVSLYAQAGWSLDHVGEQLGWAPGTRAVMHARYRHIFQDEMAGRMRSLNKMEETA